MYILYMRKTQKFLQTKFKKCSSYCSWTWLPLHF